MDCGGLPPLFCQPTRGLSDAQHRSLCPTANPPLPNPLHQPSKPLQSPTMSPSLLLNVLPTERFLHTLHSQPRKRALVHSRVGAQQLIHAFLRMRSNHEIRQQPPRFRAIVLLSSLGVFLKCCSRRPPNSLAPTPLRFPPPRRIGQQTPRSSPPQPSVPHHTTAQITIRPFSAPPATPPSPPKSVRR
jgi:hypothetical protein